MCADHSEQRFLLPHIHKSTPQRVCDHCFMHLSLQPIRGQVKSTHSPLVDSLPPALLTTSVVAESERGDSGTGLGEPDISSECLAKDVNESVKLMTREEESLVVATSGGVVMAGGLPLPAHSGDSIKEGGDPAATTTAYFPSDDEDEQSDEEPEAPPVLPPPKPPKSNTHRPGGAVPPSGRQVVLGEDAFESTPSPSAVVSYGDSEDVPVSFMQAQSNRHSLRLTEEDFAAIRLSERGLSNTASTTNHTDRQSGVSVSAGSDLLDMVVAAMADSRMHVDSIGRYADSGSDSDSD